MAPEVLNETLDTRAFEAFKMADMYSFSLVLWEMGRRTLTGDKLTVVDEYRVPYWDCVPSDPSFEDMHDVVCVKGIRPPIPARWQSEKVRCLLIAYDFSRRGYSNIIFFHSKFENWNFPPLVPSSSGARHKGLKVT